MTNTFIYYDDIYWIDLIIESTLTADLLLGGTLSAIYRLKEKNQSAPFDSASRQIIGLDLITLSSFSISRSLDDLIDAVKQWPIFGFNYVGHISAYDNISGLIKELRNIKEVIPIIHGLLPFDVTEHGDGLSPGLCSTLAGTTKTAAFDGSSDEINMLQSLPFVRSHITITSGKYVDVSKITWLGVVNESVADWLSDLYSLEPHILNISAIEGNQVLTKEAKEECLNYIRHSKLFQFKEDSGDFIFKFNRKYILPQVRRRSSVEFSDTLDITQSTGLSKDDKNPNRIYWYYHFNKFFNTASTVYIEKLRNMLGALIVSFGHDKICLIENGLSEVFNALIETVIVELYGDATRIVRAVRSRRPRLFPYEDLDEHDRVLVITDIINTGRTLDSSIEVIEQYKAQVVGIACLVVNAEKLDKPFSYLSKEKIYPIWYFMKRELLPAEAQGTAQREEVRENALDVRALHDYAFFWELLQKGGDIGRKHYIAHHRVEGATYESHFDVMFDFAGLEKAPDLLQDFLSQFDRWSADRRFNIFISNTSRFAPNVANLLRKHVSYDTELLMINFSKDDYNRTRSAKNKILLIDDGINTYGSLSRIVRQLVDLGYQKNEIGICALVERQCIPKANNIIANEAFVEKFADLFVYYKTAIPFFVLQKSLGQFHNISCPICRLNEYYMLLNQCLPETTAIRHIGARWRNALPETKIAPLRIEAPTNEGKV